jgi:hypothetical protein
MWRALAARTIRRGMGGFFSKAATRGRRGINTLMVAALAVAVLALSAGAAAAEPALDSTAPTVSIDAPSSHTAPDGRLRLYFSADEAGVSFACQVDDEAAAPCDAPHDFTLAEGEHVIAVRATDDAGNTSAPVTWNVTATAAPPPTTVITIVDHGPIVDPGPMAVTPQTRVPRIEIGSACMEVSASRANARFSLRGRNALVRFQAPAAARYAEFTLRSAHGGQRRGAVVGKLGSADLARAGATHTTRIALTSRQRRLVRSGDARLAIAYGSCRGHAGEWHWVAPRATARR